VMKATSATSGLVMVNPENELILSAFHANCGGQTANSEDVWSREVPYLRSISDPFSKGKSTYHWTKTYEKKEFLNKILNQLSIIIIDEKSFLGKRFMVKLNKNLKEIMGNNEIMGGIKLVLLGDNWQLEPVKDTPLWSDAVYIIDEDEEELHNDYNEDAVEQAMKRNENIQNYKE